MLLINCGITRVVCERKYHQGAESEAMFRTACVELVYKHEEVQRYPGQKPTVHIAIPPDQLELLQEEMAIPLVQGIQQRADLADLLGGKLADHGKGFLAVDVLVRHVGQQADVLFGPYLCRIGLGLGRVDPTHTLQGLIQEFRGVALVIDPGTQNERPEDQSCDGCVVEGRHRLNSSRCAGTGVITKNIDTAIIVGIQGC